MASTEANAEIQNANRYAAHFTPFANHNLLSMHIVSYHIILRTFSSSSAVIVVSISIVSHCYVSYSPPRKHSHPLPVLAPVFFAPFFPYADAFC